MAKFIVYLTFSCFLGCPLSAFAQFIDKGEQVEVAKGTRLCSNATMEQAKGSLDPGRIFWKVTSTRRSNGTQTVSSFIHETVYDRLSGDKKNTEKRYDEDYAVLFKRDPTHKGMLFVISPNDGRIEATVEVCQKGK